MRLRGVFLSLDERDYAMPFNDAPCIPLWRRPRVRQVAVLLLMLFLLLWFVIVLNGASILQSHLDEGTPFTYRGQGDYDDVGCNGHPLHERITDLQRIRDSVRKEVMETARQSEEMNRQHEAFTKEIRDKQSELAQLQADIDNAKIVLRDQLDRRNVRVSLPHSPLLPSSVNINTGFSLQYVHGAVSLEDVLDYSRCSISSSLRVYIYPQSGPSPLKDALLKSPYSVADAESACLYIFLQSDKDNKFVWSTLPFWGKRGTNHVIVNQGPPIAPEEMNKMHSIVVQDHFPSGSYRHKMDYALFSELPARQEWDSLPKLLPFSRTNEILVLVRTKWARYEEDTQGFMKSARQSEDNVTVLYCAGSSNESKCHTSSTQDALQSSSFVVLIPDSSVDTAFSRYFLSDLLSVLRSGSIPVILSMDTPLPFEDTLDWSSLVVRVPLSRFPEMHFILRSFSMADVLEMRRRGRSVLENYLGDARVLSCTLLSSLSSRLLLPPRSPLPSPSTPLFDRNFTAPILTPVNSPTNMDDEYLGPLESPFESPSYLHNFSSLSLYSSTRWNSQLDVGGVPEFLPNAADMPADAEFFEDSSVGFRPIDPGAGREFSQALGGNRQREQFTVVMLTYNRDSILAASLERLHKCPYLNKVVVIWNSDKRKPQGAWPRLHVPVEFINGTRNSLNNRFIPWDRINTEAVLSLDDDIDLKHHEIVFAFRVWREERTRIVGFPARQHSRFGSDVFYNSNHTCQLSMILTGAAFIHKHYFYAYTYSMPQQIRDHVEEVKNCEDIAMNFLVAHLTRKPPMKTTSKWTLRCSQRMYTACLSPGEDALSSQPDHFNKRHDCIRKFINIYGYNPLKYSQFRADSVLFKTRVPVGKEKCFRYV